MGYWIAIMKYFTGKGFGEALLIFHNSRKKKKTSLKVNYIITQLHISGECKIRLNMKTYWWSLNALWYSCP